MSLTLFIIRHGERVDAVDPNFRYTSPTPYDTPLTSKGKRQAKRTGAYIHDIQLETVVKDIDRQRKVEYVIYTSPLLRTVETAIGIAEGIASSRPNLPIDSIQFRIEPAISDWHYHSYYRKAIPNSIIESRTKELRLLIKQDQDTKDQKQSQLSFKADFEYEPISSELPAYPEGIMDALARCSNAFEKITSPFIERLRQDPSKDVVLIIVTHGWCFNAIQDACFKGCSWIEVRYCAVTRAKWIPKDENSEDIYDIGKDALDDNSSAGKWALDIMANIEHLKDIKV
ncbi:histidine phosphatase superfamily [Gigaspora rosea]|uniref:Histidine phosphatase superfamily n=1 Tax=Gigaspora rosea TaxID=44941 RepID=A0A397UAD0_9GLOM|nr:histidine phosphatase superfamily [Gigaspora rosea]